MVKKIKETYQCGECKLFYADVLLAKKCEKWCKRHKSCNLDITKHAIKKETFILIHSALALLSLLFGVWI